MASHMTLRTQAVVTRADIAFTVALSSKLDLTEVPNLDLQF